MRLDQPLRHIEPVGRQRQRRLPQLRMVHRHQRLALIGGIGLGGATGAEAGIAQRPPARRVLRIARRRLGQRGNGVCGGR
jgi:hypothetical protein